MKEEYLRALCRAALFDKGYLPIRDSEGRLLAFREDISTLFRQTGGAEYLLQIIDGDRLTAGQIAGLLGHNREALEKAGGQGYHYFIELFVFEQGPDGEKAALFEQQQLHNPTGHVFLKCLSVNLAARRVQRHYRAPMGYFGLQKTLLAAFNAPDLPASTPEELEKLAAKAQEELSPRFRAQKPVMTWVFIGLNLLIWAALELYAIGSGKSYSSLLYTFGEKENAQIILGQWWRLFTAMFLHGGLMHVAVNCWSLYVVGLLVERIFGHGRFAAIYLFSGLMGNLSSFVFSQNPSVGASGAIFGLMGALLWLGLERPRMFKVYFGAGVIATIVINLAYGAANTSIDNFAHLGGLLGGFLAAGTVYPAQGDERVHIGKPFLAAVSLLTAAAFAAAGFLLPNNRVYAAVARMETQINDKQPSAALETGKAVETLSAGKTLRAELYADLTQASLNSGDNALARGYAAKLEGQDKAHGLYALAVIDYNSGQYISAKADLEQLQTLDPSYEGLSSFLSEVNQALLGK